MTTNKPRTAFKKFDALCIPGVVMGADPELFIQSDGRIAESSAIIPKEGLMTYGDGSPDNRAQDRSFYERGNVVQDGVQVELHPNPSGCRALLGLSMKSCLLGVERALKDKGMSLMTNTVIDIPEDEIKKMSETARRLGCAPSLNIHGEKPIVVGENYPTRSAGGHIHLNVEGDRLETLIPLLDFFVGNICVLIDRDPLQKKRRELYGRAGEHRNKHSVEYRVLSNFWLRSYQLMSLVMQLSRLALAVAGYCQRGYGHMKYYHVDSNPTAREWLFKRIRPKLLEKAINENDAKLALYHYKVFKMFINKFIVNPEDENLLIRNSSYSPIWPNSLPWFDYFIEKGIDHWWGPDIFDNWRGITDGHGIGWEAFLINTVKTEYLKSKENKDDAKEIAAE